VTLLQSTLNSTCAPDADADDIHMMACHMRLLSSIHFSHHTILIHADVVFQIIPLIPYVLLAFNGIDIASIL
jgi:hypothetical protein